ncbi:hypothetical protein [Inquilinus ginsengisoli]|uniref:hypothetical protein n=1 Tax=Inquilinus ginsengisoli TaxID=363840 RepID=UPI003D19C0C0
MAVVTRSLRYAILAGLILGGIVGGLMVSIAMQHNPQGLYVDTETGRVDYFALSKIFLGWSATVAGAVLFAFFAAGAVCRLLRLRR